MRIARNLCREEPKPEHLRWIRFFDDPSQWWDNRATAKWTNQPDFKHALTGEALWINSAPSPDWLSLKLASLQPPVNSSRPSRAAYKTTTSNSSHTSALLARLKEAANAGDLAKGRILHQDSIRTGTNTDLYVSSSLVHMYVKCGCMEEARALFENIPAKNPVSWNTVIMGYVTNGEEEIALELVQRMRDEGCPPNERTFVTVLKACTGLAEKEKGDVVSGELVKATSLERGRTLLSELRDCPRDDFVYSALIDMYSKCGSMSLAQEVFDSVSTNNVVSWTALILGYAENGEGKRALSLFLEMQSRGCSPNSLTFIAALKACTSLAAKEDGPLKRKALEQGMYVHKHVIKAGQVDILLENMLVDMYAKCGSIVDARGVFDRMSFHTVVSWNILLSAYAELGEEELCLELFERMTGLDPNPRTYVAALKACTGVKNLYKGTWLHSQASERGYDRDLFVANTLIDMYVKSGSLVNARRVFEGIEARNVVSWNALLVGLAESSEVDQTLELFSRMQREGCQLDGVSYVAVLKACGAVDKTAGLKTVEQVHGLISGNEQLEKDLHAASSLIETYARLGCMEKSQEVFKGMVASPDVVMWTSLILGYVDNNRAEDGLETFARMQGEGECSPDAKAFAAALKACASLAASEEARWMEDEKRLLKVAAYGKGRYIHDQANRTDPGWLESDVLLASSLVEMYSKAGAMVEARNVLEGMRQPSFAAWNSLLLGYVEWKQPELAREMVTRLKREMRSTYGISMDYRMYVSALKAVVVVGEAVAVEDVKALHAEVCRLGMEAELVLATSLIDAYGKSGSVGESEAVFDSLTAGKDVVVWNALIGVYSYQGDGRRALECVREMTEAGVRGDGVSFVSALTACSRAGLVEEGVRMFEEMEGRFGVVAGVEHYVCVVDMLGRGSKLEVAVEMVKRMGCSSKVAWMALLGACRKWRNVRVGEVAFQMVMEIDDRESAAYDLMASIYSGEHK